MIKLEINGDTPAEFEAALRTVVALMGTAAVVVTPGDPVMPEVRATEDAEAAKPTRTPRKKAEPAKEPEGNAPVSEATEALSDQATTQDDTSQTSDNGQTAQTGASPSDEVTIEQIRELTLKVVDQCGKQKIEDVLSQFGVARATQVSEELRPELAAKLQEALDEVAA